MNKIKALILLGITVTLSACENPPSVTNGAPGETQTDQGQTQASLKPVTIAQINVVVPRSLKVSEENIYLPTEEIVWRGDPIGDRHAQVQAIVEEAFGRTAAAMSGARKVVVDARVLRFHALTEKARYSTGGVHNIEFDLTIRDVATGKPVLAPRRVRADLVAYGGQDAIEADARGETQKVRITAFLAEVLRQEILVPGGYRTKRLGLIQHMNDPL